MNIFVLKTNCLLSVIFCTPNEKQDKENLGQKQLSDNTGVDFGATNVINGYQWALRLAIFGLFTVYVVKVVSNPSFCRMYNLSNRNSFFVG